MSITIRCIGLVKRIVSFSLATLCAASFSVAAQAQTAPSLLPYTVTAVAGGGTANPSTGGACPVSGLISTDAFGDGCLATEIALVAPRYANVDSGGNIFFSDYTNGLVRRIDATTGVVTAIAGGATASPAAGAACGSNTSIDKAGDGCLSTLVKLYHPSALIFAPNGDLYFSDSGNSNVRKVAATNGVIETGGIISLVDGNVGGTYGYTSNNSTTTINAATQSYLDGPYGLSLDAAGNLYIADEYKNALLVVNTNTTGSTTVAGVTIPAGTVSKIAGAYPSTSPTSTCPNGSSGTFGCSYGTYADNAPANSSLLDTPFAVTVDPTGTIYFANEYNQVVGKIDTTGNLTNYAGTLSGYGTAPNRGPAGTFGIGSDFGIAADSNSNVYVTDAFNGVIWRIDADKSMYVVAGAKTVCSTATDAYGDGCPATQAIFGSSSSSGSNYAAIASPGVFGVNVDADSNLYVGDTVTNLVRKISSGTQFGVVGDNQPTQTVQAHFIASDPPSANPFSITDGSDNFTLGAFNCAPANTDGTTDCTASITATPSILGAFGGTLMVTASSGTTASFPLTGTYVVTPTTRTSVAISTGAVCSGATVNGVTTVGTSAPVTLTASVASSGTPTGTITFFANNTQIGTPQPVANGSASLTYTFSTTGHYVITASYSGDSYFIASSGTAPTSITSAAPGFDAPAVVSYQQNTVSAGQTALYSFTIKQNVYSGTISFACTGLPAYSSCSFSPSTISNAGCSTTSTVALSILTQQATSTKVASLGVPGSGPWQALGILPGVLLALYVGIRRRKSPLRFGQVWLALALLFATSGLVACGKSGQLTASTPSGTSTVTITATGSEGTVQTFTVPLTVK